MSLSAAKKRDILICCIAALLILCAMAARILGSPEGAPGLSSMIRNGIYMGLTAAWGVSVQRRIIQVQTRRYLIAIALLMLLWLTERAIKYEFNLSAAAARRLWYSYYIPILLIPLITVFTAMSLGRPENYKLPGWTRLLYIPTFAFMAMVLTNDRHQLVFAFPADAEIWTGGNAAHSIGYFAVVAWTAVCAAGTIIVMIEKCRRPKSRIQWLPILPVALSFVYTALYVSDVKWLRLIAGDMTVFQCLAIMAALEGCIRCGLIQSNTGYDELFGATTIGAQITDHGFRVKSASHSALPISLEKMEQALEGPVQLDKNTLLKGQEISSGYVFWQEDISELQGVLDQFQTVQDELRDTGDVLKAEAEQRAHELLELVGLPDKADSYPAQLSGGQQQRVAIARALATHPKVLLCDEATSALDPNTTRQILELIRDINKKLGITVVVITHQMSVVKEICTHVAILDEGRVAESGLVGTVFAAPKSAAGRRLVFPGGADAQVYDPAGEKLVRLVFKDAATTSIPMIARLASEEGILCNVISASTQKLSETVYGSMMLGIPSSQFDKAVAFLHNVANVQVEEVE